MDKPRILFIMPLPPPVHGSSMVSRSILDSRLIRSAFQVDCVNLSTSRRMDEIGKGGWRKMLRFVRSYVGVFSKLLFHRYDACYLAITCHGMGFLKDALFVAMCKLWGRKVILHHHNKGLGQDVCRWPYRGLMPWIYRDTEVILLSERLYADVKAVVTPAQIHVCPNGIADSVVNTSVSLPHIGVPRLLFLSNLLVSKGVWVLLETCSCLKKRGYSFVCDMVGGETTEINRSKLEEEINIRGLKDQVFYWGPQYGEQKELFFQQADIFVQPTFEDCFPLTVLEAMQHGLPVVSTDEGAIPDMVVDGYNGFICQRQDIHSLADSVERLLKDSALRKQMGEKGCLRYKERFTQEAFERTFLHILSDILN